MSAALRFEDDIKSMCVCVCVCAPFAFSDVIQCEITLQQVSGVGEIR